MNLTDIITLAKNGYKPSDIRELIEISQTLNEEIKMEDLTGSEDVTESEEESKEPEESEDFEKLYNEAKEELAETVKKLNLAQQANIRTQRPEVVEESGEDVLMDFIKNIK